MEEKNDEIAREQHGQIPGATAAAKCSAKAKCWNHPSVILAGVLIVLVLGGGIVAIGQAFHRGERVGNRGGATRGVTMEHGADFERGGMMGGRGREVESRGNTGKIAKIDGNNLMVTLNSKDQAVAINDTTSIYSSNGDIIAKSDLKVDDNITIIGRPNSSGQLIANIIQAN